MLIWDCKATGSSVEFIQISSLWLIYIWYFASNFSLRLVLIAEKDKVYDEFPTPLINRLEKHYLVTSTILTDKQEVLLKDIMNWVEEFLHITTTMM